MWRTQRATECWMLTSTKTSQVGQNTLVRAVPPGAAVQVDVSSRSRESCQWQLPALSFVLLLSGAVGVEGCFICHQGMSI
jgi:hypothetical protein